MNTPIRVMLCDDSGTMRRLIKKSIELDPGIKVVAEAKHGKECVSMLPKVRPDAVILDVEMPVMDGIDTVKAIRKIEKSLPIIMFSSLTSKGAEATFDAMQAGANSFATKPQATGHVDGAFKQVKESLIPQLKSLTRRKPVSRAGIISKAPKAAKKEKQATSISDDSARSNVSSIRIPTRTDIIAIGVSTGGPDALEEVLSQLPKKFGKPIVITQHMPAVFTKMLAQRLSDKTGLDVREAEQGQMLRPDQILIAPGDFHLEFQRKGTAVHVSLTQEPPENSCRPAVDPMFRSIARIYGQRALGIVLTGMGRDGTDGAQALKAAGAQIYVQDESTSTVWGMPRKVFEAGFADRVMPLDEIGKTIARCGGSGLRSGTGSFAKVGSK